MSSAAAEPRPPRNQRINLRASTRQEALLRRAAEATDHTMTDFILDSAVVRAERVLADRRWFLATEEQLTEFQRLLDEPVPPTPRLDALVDRPLRFDED